MAVFERYDAIIIGSGQAGGPLATALVRSGRKIAVSMVSGGKYISCRGPGEWFRTPVMLLDEGRDLPGLVFFRREYPPLEQPPAEDAEPYFDLVEPAGVGGGEMKVESGVPLKPRVDLRSLVNLEVIEDDVQILVGWRFCVDELEKPDELDAAVRLLDPSNQPALVDKEGRHGSRPRFALHWRTRAGTMRMSWSLIRYRMKIRCARQSMEPGPRAG